MCGGAFSTPASTDPTHGLSPRVRGSPRNSRKWWTQARSIPACAGEPLNWSRTKTRRRVYPRVCGGARTGRRPTARSPGLSPRVRGSRDGAGIGSVGVWSIPACAGEPAVAATAVGLGEVYPRVCGGATDVGERTPGVTGLSPRVRGSPGMDGKPRYRLRSIPACAGEPTPGINGVSASQVYPRVCGGARKTNFTAGLSSGLSPRVRGSRIRLCFPFLCRRSIPACAGEPMPDRPAEPPNQVYPRVCGGARVGVLLNGHSKGLSPRVRGSHGCGLSPSKRASGLSPRVRGSRMDEKS